MRLEGAACEEHDQAPSRYRACYRAYRALIYPSRQTSGGPLPSLEDSPQICPARRLQLSVTTCTATQRGLSGDNALPLSSAVGGAAAGLRLARSPRHSRATGKNSPECYLPLCSSMKPLDGYLDSIAEEARRHKRGIKRIFLSLSLSARSKCMAQRSSATA